MGRRWSIAVLGLLIAVPLVGRAAKPAPPPAAPTPADPCSAIKPAQSLTASTTSEIGGSVGGRIVPVKVEAGRTSSAANDTTLLEGDALSRAWDQYVLCRAFHAGDPTYAAVMQQMVLGSAASPAATTPGLAAPAPAPGAPSGAAPTPAMASEHVDPSALVGTWTLQLTRTWDTCEPEDAPEKRQTYTWRVDQEGSEFTATVTDGVTVFRALKGALVGGALVLNGRSQDGKLAPENMLNEANFLLSSNLPETHLLGTTEYRLAIQPDGQLVGRRVLTYLSREARKANADGVEWWRWFDACASEYAVVARRM